MKSSTIGLPAKGLMIKVSQEFELIFFVLNSNLGNCRASIISSRAFIISKCRTANPYHFVLMQNKHVLVQNKHVLTQNKHVLMQSKHFVILSHRFTIAKFLCSPVQPVIDESVFKFQLPAVNKFNVMFLFCIPVCKSIDKVNYTKL
ncbi:hypothetical protein DMUE_6439 [Dictyocoela muelleri]|nr:hypothetical protein DMUE_6439 [Dictyocoela muelleri]